MRRPVFSLLLLSALGACSTEPSASTVADVNAAAQAAQSDIDAYAANTLKPAPSLSTRPVASAPTASVSAALPATAEPSPVDNAQAAATVVQHYFALIAARNYAAAYRLWDGNGLASGVTARGFAASFAGYEIDRAEVGAPGVVEAGAGQRYVEVPVTVQGARNPGDRPFRITGSVTLHRTGDIDGATVEQRRWRISASNLPPRSDQSAAAVETTAADDCTRGQVRVSRRNGADGEEPVWRHAVAAVHSDPQGCLRTY